MKICSLSRTALIGAIVFIGFGIPRASQARDPERGGDVGSEALISVIASGTGSDESAALKQAFSNAVTQAVGAVVDAETVVKNDQIIQDQILTASRAVIARYEVIGKPTAERGLMTVRIHAYVERSKLVEKLDAAHVSKAAMNGQDAFARAVTELKDEKDTAAMIAKIFADFPTNVMKAEAIGRPRLVSKDEREATIAVSVRYAVDPTLYGKWYRAFVPILKRLSTSHEELRWDPQKIKATPAGNTRAYAPEPDAAIKVTADETSRGFEWPYLVPGWDNRNGKHAGGTLLVIERAGRSPSLLMHFDDVAYRALMKSCAHYPHVEVRLEGSSGRELDGQDGECLFPQPGRNAYQAMPIWQLATDGRCEELLRAYEGQAGAIRIGINDKASGIAIWPYVGGPEFAVPSFTVEYMFKLPLETLKDLTTVTVRLSTRAVDISSTRGDR